jgi:hypothetical protein
VAATTSAPLLGATGDGGIDLLNMSERPGARPATNSRRGRSPMGTSEWRTSASEAAAEHSELPAGWHSIGASGPGYASGSNLSAVPSSAASGTLGMEASLSFDEPSWN